MNSSNKETLGNDQDLDKSSIEKLLSQPADENWVKNVRSLLVELAMSDPKPSSTITPSKTQKLNNYNRDKKISNNMNKDMTLKFSQFQNRARSLLNISSAPSNTSSFLKKSTPSKHSQQSHDRPQPKSFSRQQSISSVKPTEKKPLSLSTWERRKAYNSLQRQKSFGKLNLNIQNASSGNKIINNKPASRTLSAAEMKALRGGSLPSFMCPTSASRQKSRSNDSLDVTLNEESKVNNTSQQSMLRGRYGSLPRNWKQKSFSNNSDLNNHKQEERRRKMYDAIDRARERGKKTSYISATSTLTKNSPSPIKIQNKKDNNSPVKSTLISSAFLSPAVSSALSTQVSKSSSLTLKEKKKPNFNTRTYLNKLMKPSKNHDNKDTPKQNHIEISKSRDTPLSKSPILVTTPSPPPEENTVISSLIQNESPMKCISPTPLTTCSPCSIPSSIPKKQNASLFSKDTNVNEKNSTNILDSQDIITRFHPKKIIIEKEDENSSNISEESKTLKYKLNLKPPISSSASYQTPTRALSSSPLYQVSPLSNTNDSITSTDESPLRTYPDLESPDGDFCYSAPCKPDNSINISSTDSTLDSLNDSMNKSTIDSKSSKQENDGLSDFLSAIENERELEVKNNNNTQLNIDSPTKSERRMKENFKLALSNCNKNQPSITGSDQDNEDEISDIDNIDDEIVDQLELDKQIVEENNKRIRRLSVELQESLKIPLELINNDTAGSVFGDYLEENDEDTTDGDDNIFTSNDSQSHLFDNGKVITSTTEINNNEQKLDNEIVNKIENNHKDNEIQHFDSNSNNHHKISLLDLDVSSTSTSDITDFNSYISYSGDSGEKEIENISNINNLTENSVIPSIIHTEENSSGHYESAKFSEFLHRESELIFDKENE